MSSDLAGTGAPLSEHARRAARAYGAAADHYGGDALSFWDRFGAATVSRLELAPGGAVLDLCCGAGASAIPAAHQLGHPDRFWDVVLGSGYRATVDALSPAQRELVRERLLAGLREREVTTVRTDVVFGTAGRSG